MSVLEDRAHAMTTAVLRAAGLDLDCFAARAIRTINRQMKAKKTKHFAHEGVVIDERTTDDNDAQLRAAELAGRFLGLEAPKQASVSPSFGVAIEIDPQTGVIRVVAGQRQAQQALPVVVEGQSA